MKALLLSGGEGTRMRPFTLTTPKPMLPVANVPLISRQFELLKQYNIDESVVSAGYKAEYFRRVIGDLAKKSGVKVHLCVENTPLGTGGGVRNACRFFRKDSSPFFVFNGDIISDLNLKKMLDIHKNTGACAVIALVKVSNPSAYGLVLTDEDMKIKKFIEKPKPEEIVTDTINAGVYVFSPEIVDAIPPDNPVSLERAVFPYLLESGKKLMGYVHCGYWIDVGTVEKYKKANFDMLEGNFLKGENTVLKEGVKTRGRVIIGDNCSVGRGVHLENSIVMNDSVIKEGCIISDSVIGSGVLIGNNCEIRTAAIADKSLILHLF